MATVHVVLRKDILDNINLKKNNKGKYALDIDKSTFYMAGDVVPDDALTSSMSVSKRALKEITKHINDDTSGVMELSKKQRKQLVDNAKSSQTSGEGAALDPVSKSLKVVGGVQDVVSTLFKGEEYDQFEDKINARMKYLSGRGVDASKSFKTGIAVAEEVEKSGIKKPLSKSELIQLANKVSANKSGDGLSGEGDFEDFINGFVYGFTNPIEAIKLLGAEISNAFKGGKGLDNDDCDCCSCKKKHALTGKGMASL